MRKNPTGNVYYLFPEQEKLVEQAAVPPLDTLPEGDADGVIPPERLGVATPTPVEDAPPYFSTDEVQARARRSHPSQGNIPPA